MSMTQSIRQSRFIRGDENGKLGDGMEETRHKTLLLREEVEEHKTSRPQYKGRKWGAADFTTTIQVGNGGNSGLNDLITGG